MNNTSLYNILIIIYNILTNYLFGTKTMNSYTYNIIIIIIIIKEF